MQKPTLSRTCFQSAALPRSDQQPGSAPRGTGDGASSGGALAGFSATIASQRQSAPAGAAVSVKRLRRARPRTRIGEFRRSGGSVERAATLPSAPPRWRRPEAGTTNAPKVPRSRGCSPVLTRKYRQRRAVNPRGSQRVARHDCRNGPTRVKRRREASRAIVERSCRYRAGSRARQLRDHYLPVRSRCLQPGQQHGRRWPSSSSSWVRRMRRSRVVCCLASSTQQTNSLRAKGVMSFQAASAVAFALSASRRSPGSSCTTLPGTASPVTGQWY